MPGKQLLVIIIETPNSNRSQPLLRSLGCDSRFDVVRLPACMLKTYSDVNALNFEISLEAFNALHGRIMSPQEIGCATSHNIARQLISRSEVGGVILEDDARILDLDSFFYLCTTFVNDKGDSRSVLSLTGFRQLVLQNSQFRNNASKNIVALFGKPDLAVAYALTPSAAKNLYEANTPISTVSDWPITRCQFFALLSTVVSHGDAKTSSVILVNNTEFRHGSNLSQKIKLLLFFPIYLRKKSPNLHFQDYFETIYLDRLFWAYDFYRIKTMIFLHGFFSK